MLKFNNKPMLSRSVLNPVFAFDPDLRNLKIRNIDPRTDVSISYELNGISYNIEDNQTFGYDIPENIRYSLRLTLNPENESLKSLTKSYSIFANNEDCKYYKYSGDSFESTDIYSYVGTSGVLKIPEKHNLVNTTSATLTDLSSVIDDTISVTTPQYMTDFYIKDDRITEFNILGNLNPVDYQFADFPNLTSITGLPSVCSDYMFYNSPKLNLGAITNNKFTSLGEKAFFNTPSNKYILTTVSELPDECFSYDNSFGHDDLEKVIFTTSDTVNGFDKLTLPEAAYVRGMTYYDPVEDAIKNHQVFCGLKTQYLSPSWWFEENETIDDRVISVVYDLDSDRLTIRTATPKIIGFKIEAKNTSNTNLGKIIWLPQMLLKSNGNAVDDWKEDNTFYLSLSRFYNTPYPNKTDVLKITPISLKGYTSNYYRFTLNGNVVDSGNSSEKDFYIINYDVETLSKTDAEYTEVKNKDSITLPTAWKAFNKFNGWYDKRGNYIGMPGETYTPTRDITLVPSVDVITEPPVRGPDTKTATRPITKAFCTGKPSEMGGVEFILNGDVITSASGWYICIDHDPNLELCADYYYDGVYQTSFEFEYYRNDMLDDTIQMFYLWLYRIFDSNIKIWGPRGVLKVYYKENPSYGEFEMDLSTKDNYTKTS